MEVSKITLTVHKDPKQLLTRNLDLTFQFDDGLERTYHRKVPKESVILHFMEALEKLDIVIEKYEKQKLTLTDEGRTENARDEKDREPQASSSTDSIGKGSSEEGEG